MSTVKSFDKHNMLRLLDPPASQQSANSTWLQPFANSQGNDRAVYMLVVGDLTTDTMDMQIYQATTSAGGSAKVITGAAITQLTTATAGAIVTIELGPGAMDDANSFTYARAQVLVNSAGTEVWGLIYILHNLRYPGKFSQHATYAEQIRLYDA